MRLARLIIKMILHLTDIVQLLFNSFVKTDIESNLHSSEPRVLKKSASRYISYLVLLQTTKTQEKFH